jgi:hypothetical protein
MNEMNDIYNRCLNCGKKLVHTEGKRAKVFCDTTCRSNYWQKSDRLEKKGFSAEKIVKTITSGWKTLEVNKKILRQVENAGMPDLPKTPNKPNTDTEVKNKVPANPKEEKKQQEPKENELTAFQIYQRKKLGIK